MNIFILDKFYNSIIKYIMIDRLLSKTAKSSRITQKPPDERESPVKEAASNGTKSEVVEEAPQQDTMAKVPA